MAMGKPKCWATAEISESIYLGKAGLKIVIWDKYHRTRKGTAIISVGGIRWFPYKAKKYYKMSWDKLSKYLEGQSGGRQ